jgi:hypothetical protein
MTDPKPNNDPNPNEQGENKAVAPIQAGGALASASLTALVTMLNGVDAAALAGRSGIPLLQFKSREDGTWRYGQRRAAVEEGSLWAVNLLSMRHGWVCFGPDNKPVGERLVPINQPMPAFAELPNLGPTWQEQWSAGMRCTSGTDSGVEVLFKASTVGGINVLAGLIEAVRDRANSGQHGDIVVPVVSLDRDSYQHQKYGRVWIPILTIRDWMSLAGPTPASTPPAAPPTPPTTPPTGPATATAAEQPRRRRVA